MPFQARPELMTTCEAPTGNAQASLDELIWITKVARPLVRRLLELLHDQQFEFGSEERFEITPAVEQELHRFVPGQLWQKVETNERTVLTFCLRETVTPLDGELWIGREQFQRTVSIVRRGDASELWHAVRYLIFDAPAVALPFEQRLASVAKLLAADRPPYAIGLAQSVCRSAEHLTRELQRIEALGGEGLKLRQPASLYEPRRSATLLKVKSFQDCEAVVIGHEPGRGRHKGRLGALLVRLPNGIRFACGTGLSDVQRNLPPAIGQTITVKYQELTDAGVPRFPVFVGIRPDEPATPSTIHSSSPRKGRAGLMKTWGCMAIGG